jgi:hypothetical protein
MTDVKVLLRFARRLFVEGDDDIHHMLLFCALDRSDWRKCVGGQDVVAWSLCHYERMSHCIVQAAYIYTCFQYNQLSKYNGQSKGNDLR